MQYQEISGETLSKEDKRLIRTHYYCVNCEEPYDGRLIMVALLKYSLRWWHYPTSGACKLNQRGAC